MKTIVINESDKIINEKGDGEYMVVTFLKKSYAPTKK